MGQEVGKHKNELFQLLSNHRRRFALHACKQTDLPLTLSDLAEQVAAWENRKSRSEITYEERRRVYTSMQQTHLPAMEEAGVITYEGDEIDLTERVDELELYLEVVPANSIPWGEYYLGLSAVCAALVAAVGVGIYPEWIPQLAWAGVVVALFAVSAAVHVWGTRRSRLGSADAPPQLE